MKNKSDNVKNGDRVLYSNPITSVKFITEIVEWNYSRYEPYEVMHTEGFGSKKHYRKI